MRLYLAGPYSARGPGRPPPPPAKRLTATVDPFTLHADTAVATHDRDGLERPVATALVRRSRTAASACPPWGPSGQVAYRLRRPGFTGQTEIGPGEQRRFDVAFDVTMATIADLIRAARS